VGGVSSYIFEFRTAAQSFATAFPSYSFPVGSGTGVQRVTFQLDLVAGTFQGWVNKVQQPVTAGSTAWTPGTGVFFYQNDYFPFLVGGLSNWIITNDYTPTDLGVYGLWVGGSLRYANNGVGTPQVALDGTTTSDADLFLYSNNGTAGLCYLTMTDRSTGPHDGRYVTYQVQANSWGGPYGNTGSQGSTGFGVWMWAANPPSQGNGLYCQLGATLADLAVNTLGAYGQAVCVGGVLDMTIHDVTATGGFHGIGGANMGSSYIITVENCAGTGGDASYYGSQQIIWMRNWETGTAYETALRFQSCAVDAKNLFLTGQVGGRYAIHMLDGFYGGSYAFDNVSQDNEGFIYPTVAAIRFENANGASSSSLVLKNHYWGSIGPRAVLVDLVDRNPLHYAITRPAHFEMTNVLAGSNGVTGCPALVRTSGRLIRGKVEVNVRNPLTPMFLPTAADGTGGVSAVHRGYDAPPNHAGWTKNADVVLAENAPPGLWRKYTCRQSGYLGSANPPTWEATDLLEITGTELGAISTAVSAMAVTSAASTGRASWGEPGAAARNNELNYLLGTFGMPASPVATLALGLSTRFNTLWEPTRVFGVGSVANGYARVATPSTTWSASSGGVVTNAQAIVFAAATVDWVDAVQAVFLIDTATGAVYWIATLDAPLVVKAGTVVSFPVGSIVFTR
jgi:hypothetical protein